MWLRLSLGLAAALVLTGCRTASLQLSPQDWQAWKARRLESIGGTDGWSTLVALFWLPEGTNTLGSSPTAALKLSVDVAPSEVGEIIRSGKKVQFHSGRETEAIVDHQRVYLQQLQSDAGGAKPTVVEAGSLRFFVIQRGDRLGLRVKSPQSPARRDFRGLTYFAYDAAWKIPAHLVPPVGDGPIEVPDIKGNIERQVSPGTLVFFVDGKEHRLVVFNDDETQDLWIVFRDATSGDETYGGGRFVHVPKPGDDGQTWIDFNYAYNPPCAFTPFATCPLAPQENRLDLRIRAGEKKYGENHDNSGEF